MSNNVATIKIHYTTLHLIGIEDHPEEVAEEEDEDHGDQQAGDLTVPLPGEKLHKQFLETNGGKPLISVRSYKTKKSLAERARQSQRFSRIVVFVLQASAPVRGRAAHQGGARADGSPEESVRHLHQG